MEEKIISVGIDDFQKMSDTVVYQDEDIVVVSDVEVRETTPEQVRLDGFMILACIEGMLDVEVDGHPYRLYAGDRLFVLPQTVIRRPQFTVKRKLRFSFFSPRFLHAILKMEKRAWNTIMMLKQHPVLRGEDHATPPILHHLTLVLTNELKNEPHFYRREVMRYVFSAFFCELMGWLMKTYQKDFKGYIPDTNSRHPLYVMGCFVEMLAADRGIHRTVKHYANALCYTPKHFTKLIKAACGRTPLVLITERAIDSIKYELQHSHKTIKEIADDFQFPNQSFFGKYVKLHTGMTPQELR